MIFSQKIVIITSIEKKAPNVFQSKSFIYYELLAEEFTGSKFGKFNDKK
jgi:hypothetical protein